jgi:hypothetical protein
MAIQTRPILTSPHHHASKKAPWTWSCFEYSCRKQDGAPDLPNPRRLPSEMEALRQEEAEAAKQKELVLARAAKNLASIEDGIHNEDIVRDKECVEGYKSI